MLSMKRNIKGQAKTGGKKRPAGPTLRELMEAEGAEDVRVAYWLSHRTPESLERIAAQLEGQGCKQQAFLVRQIIYRQQTARRSDGAVH